MAVTNCINQSDDGYLWIGTDGSELVRFDGDEFKEIVTSGDDNSHHINQISFRGDDVYFASRYKEFFKYSTKQHSIQHIDLKNQSLGEPLAVYYKGKDGYFITSRVILLKNGETVKRLYSLKSNQDPFIISQIIDTKNAVFILSNHGKFRLFNGKLSRISDWLNVPDEKLSKYHFGYATNEKLALTNERGTEWVEVVLNDRGGFYSINFSRKSSPLSADEKIISCSYNVHADKGGILTNSNSIYELHNKTLKSIPHNYQKPLENCTSIFTDFYGDYWITSALRGIYKVSQEPFTKIQLHEVFESPEIKYIYKTKDDEILVSLFSGSTYLGEIDKNSHFEKYDFSINDIVKNGEQYFLATNTGIRIYRKNASDNFEVKYFKNKRVTFILNNGSYLYAGIAGEGLFQISLNTGQINNVPFGADSPYAGYFYTGQVGLKGNAIYFGTNNGIYVLNKDTKSLEPVKNLNDLGAYSGVSTKDKFGTCWFTLDKGIVGLSKNGKTVIIKDKKYLNSTLFYTLTSDIYGNLIIGTNKGITTLKVDAKGNVIEYQQYNDKTGFMGYETNMRAQFEVGDGAYVGTVEGLFRIYTSLLENRSLLIAPVIHKTLNGANSQSENTGHFEFNFHVNNPKAGNIQYAYRLIEENDEWILLDKGVNAVDFVDLSNDHYHLEVKATYDQETYSNTTVFEFDVKLPIWKQNWFILILLVSVIIVNILLINRNKSARSDRFLTTKDISVYLQWTPFILLFGAIAASAIQISSPLLAAGLEMNLGQSLIMFFSLIILYFLSLTAKAAKRYELFDIYLKIGLGIVIANFLWEAYDSKLHPFNVVGLVIVTSVVPYLISQFKTTIIFSFIFISVNICFISILDDTVYPKMSFLIAIVVMSVLNVFNSYVRYDSLEKLLFVSAIINRGNISAIAFDQKGTVTYSSENISAFSKITHDELVGKNISILNNSVPYGGPFKETDVTKEFTDGEKYLVPMENEEGEVFWMEWAYRDFSKDVKLILGQDVSEKMELENTYELLVQNAEDFIYRCDVHGNFLFLNDVSFAKLGYTKEDLIGSNSLNIVSEEYRKEVRNYYEAHFNKRLSSSYMEFPILSKDGKTIWIAQHVTTLFSAGSTSHIQGFIALARDITKIRQQQQTILEQRDAITDSINYARRIQYNLLPSEQLFAENFEEHLILSRPKDIVSGDFYWMHKMQHNTILVLADCTGHGVPGSFMTLLGINLLNSTVLEQNISNPSAILNELDKKIVEYLHKSSGRIKDGMEVTICTFDERTQEMYYACAGSRFLVYDKGEFTMFKGDNKHIGDQEDGFNGYITHTTNFSKESTLYLITDGFQDQFGGPRNKKFSFRRLLELLESNIDLPLSEQKKIIEATFDKWVGKYHQTDDVTIIGVKRKDITDENL